MNSTVKMVFGLIGGLAMFLYGMNSMSDALQKTAGGKMKKVLSFLTRNPIMGALAGALVTAVLQSSSATTVMVIGFVSAGLMNLPQAISVIFGANIGTTMTAQLMAFKISNYIYPIIFIGFLMNFACKKEKWKNIGMVIFSFGLLFEGIEIMGSVMKPLATSPIFVELMGKVKDIPILGVGLGLIMTLVVQSSSATIAVLQSFASQAGPDGVSSVIGLAGAIPILLGDNIGTTITALLASIGQSKNAKRTAVAHSVFNITGSILFLFLIPLLTRFVTWISPKGNEVDVISRQIANAHTTFNVVCTLIWLPLIPVMVKIVTFLVRGNDKTKSAAYAARYLDEHVIAQPAAAMYLLSREMRRLGAYAMQMLSAVGKTAGGKNAEDSLKIYEETHTAVKSLENEMEGYVTKMFASGNLTEVQAEQTAGLLFAANNIERLADRCEEIVQTQKKIQEMGKSLSESAERELRGGIELTRKMFGQAMKALAEGDKGLAEEVAENKDQLRIGQKKSQKAHLLRVEEKACDPALTAYYSKMLYSLERAADNCVSIAEEAADGTELVNLDENDVEEEELQAVRA